MVAIKVKAFQFSFLLWPVWKQINLVEYFEKALVRHSFAIDPEYVGTKCCILQHIALLLFDVVIQLRPQNDIQQPILKQPLHTDCLRA